MFSKGWWLLSIQTSNMIEQQYFFQAYWCLARLWSSLLKDLLMNVVLDLLKPSGTYSEIFSLVNHGAAPSLPIIRYKCCVYFFALKHAFNYNKVRSIHCVWRLQQLLLYKWPKHGKRGMKITNIHLQGLKTWPPWFFEKSNQFLPYTYMNYSMHA